MRETVIENLRASFQRYQDLVEALPEEALAGKLPVPSNTIGAQIWCLIGARQSYTLALQRNGWSGFACTLGAKDVVQRARVLDALHASVAEFDRVVAEVEWTAEQEKLLLALLEHEIQHQGQLIRYGYGMGLTFPDSWVKRWALQP